MAFADATDVATRLGRDLTADEAAQATYLAELATALIAAACDKTDAWAAALSPVPTILSLFCVELVARSMPNPAGLLSLSETLGQYSSTQRFRDAAAGGGMALSELEERVIRRAVFGTNSGSVKTESLATELADLYLCCEGS